MLSFNVVAQTESDSLFTEQLSELLNADNLKELIQLTEETNSLTERQKYFRGIALYYTDREEEALQMFNEVIAADSLSQGSRYFKTYIQFAKGELEVALSTINDAINVNDEDPDYHLLKGELLYAVERLEDATLSVKKALTLEGCQERSPCFVSSLGRLLEKQDVVLGSFFL